MTYQTTIQVEAVQWTGDNFEEIELFIEYPVDHTKDSEVLTLKDDKIEIFIFLGDAGHLDVNIGDWVVRDDRPELAHFLSIYTDAGFKAKFHPITQDHLEL